MNGRRTQNEKYSLTLIPQMNHFCKINRLTETTITGYHHESLKSINFQKTY